MIRMSPKERGNVMAAFAEEEVMAEKMFKKY
jgi:hypothetical protein